MTEPDQDPEPRIPAPLAEDLASLYRVDVEVPAEVDAAILDAARATASPRPKRILLRSAVGVAAVLFLALTVFFFQQAMTEWREEEETKAAYYKEDTDRSGRVDILDAFLVARRIEIGKNVWGAWDFDASGDVGESDVQWLVRQAVEVR